jgi:hypothetical protein
MSKSNRTVDRIQAVWNMAGGDRVVDENSWPSHNGNQMEKHTATHWRDSNS